MGRIRLVLAAVIFGIYLVLSGNCDSVSASFLMDSDLRRADLTGLGALVVVLELYGLGSCRTL